MIDPFMANVGTGGIVMPKTEGTVPAANAKTVEPGETDFQAILETICGETGEKAVGAGVEARKIKAVNPRLAGERQNLSGVNRLGKPGTQAEETMEEPLSTNGVFGETDDIERQKPEDNNEVIPVMVPEMPVSTRISLVPPVGQTEPTPGATVNLQPVTNPSFTVQPGTDANPMQVVSARTTAIEDAINPQNAGPEAPAEIFNPKQLTLNQPELLVQAEVAKDQIGQTPVVQGHPGLRMAWHSMGENQTVKGESLHPAEPTSTLKTAAVDSMETGVHNIPAGDTLSEMTMTDTSRVDRPGALVRPTPMAIASDFGRMQPETQQVAALKVDGAQSLETPYLPENNLKAQEVYSFSLPVRELRQTVARMTATNSVATQNATSVSAAVPGENTEIVTNPDHSIDSNLNLAMAQLSLQKNLFFRSRGGKQPVMWDANAIIQEIRPQVVKTTSPLAGNTEGQVTGQTMEFGVNPTLGAGINSGVTTASQGRSSLGNGANAEHVDSTTVPVQQSLTGDPVTPTAQLGSSWEEVWQNLTTMQTANSSIDAEAASGRKPAVLSETEENRQPIETQAVPAYTVAETRAQVTPELNLKTEPAVNKQEVFDQLVEHAKLLVNQGQSEMELSLKPEHLGKVKLRIAVDQQVVTAQFMVESEQVKQIIETNLVQLRKLLQDTGAQVENLTITVGQQDSGTDFSQRSSSDGHGGRHHQEAARITDEGADYTPEVTKPVQTKVLIDLIA